MKNKRLSIDSKIIDIDTNRFEIKRRTGADSIKFQKAIGGMYTIMQRGKTYRKFLITNKEISENNVQSLVRKIINSLGASND